MVYTIPDCELLMADSRDENEKLKVRIVGSSDDEYGDDKALAWMDGSITTKNPQDDTRLITISFMRVN